jgi:hypothetical protein
MKYKSPGSLAIRLAVAITLLLAIAGAAEAQQTTPAATGAPAPPPKVIAVEGNLEADDLIEVKVDHLAEWAKSSPANDPSKLVPFINGLPLTKNYPVQVHTAQNHLHFHLTITPDNKGTWINLLGAPDGIRRKVAFSVGFDGQSPFDTAFDHDHPVLLTVISPVYGIVALVVVLATLILFLRLARNTNIIREPGPRPGGGKLKPYNLGRVQMAFWFFLVSSSYLAIWLITGSLDTITPSLLGLMGISAGTALGEALIDSGKDSADAGKLQGLAAEKQTLEQTIPELQASLSKIDAKPTPAPEDVASRDSLNKQLQESRTRLNQITAQIKDLTPAAGDNVSSGFLLDILSGEGGYSFHRFQIFAWTIILGIMFVSSVYNSLAMPEFSATLLGLMGISSGTYIGFKFPEQKSP